MCNFTNQTETDHRNDNLMLSYRGSERQPPSCIKLAAVMKLNMRDLMKLNTSLSEEAAFTEAVKQFNDHKDVAVNPKWMLTKDSLHERLYRKILFLLLLVYIL